MTPEDQKRIVHKLCTIVEGGIIAAIDAGKVPTNWDGFELRQLLAERFTRYTGFMPLWRKREYNNTVLVNNL